MCSRSVVWASDLIFKFFFKEVGEANLFITAIALHNIKSK